MKKREFAIRTKSKKSGTTYDFRFFIHISKLSSDVDERFYARNPEMFKEGNHHECQILGFPDLTYKPEYVIHGKKESPFFNIPFVDCNEQIWSIGEAILLLKAWSVGNTYTLETGVSFDAFGTKLFPFETLLNTFKKEQSIVIDYCHLREVEE